MLRLGSTVVERVGVSVVESVDSWDVGEEEGGVEGGVDGGVEGGVEGGFEGGVDDVEITDGAATEHGKYCEQVTAIVWD